MRLTSVLVKLECKDFSSARKVVLVVKQGFLHCLVAMQDHGALGAQVQGEHWSIPLCQLQRPARSQVRPLGSQGGGGPSFKHKIVVDQENRDGSGGRQFFVRPNLGRPFPWRLSSSYLGSWTQLTLWADSCPSPEDPLPTSALSPPLSAVPKVPDPRVLQEDPGPALS